MSKQRWENDDDPVGVEKVLAPAPEYQSLFVSKYSTLHACFRIGFYMGLYLGITWFCEDSKPLFQLLRIGLLIANLKSGCEGSRLLPGFCCLDSLEEVEICFGVVELIDLLDLQAPVIVGHDVCGDDHFEGHFHPDRGRRLATGLWGRSLSTGSIDPNSWTRT